MLPAAARLRTAEQFARVTRSGRRSGGRFVVVHLLESTGARSRAGFVVSKKVGNAVTRNRVTRRLRAIMRGRLAAMEQGTDVVVRALPAAASATSADLNADLETAITRATRRKEAAR